MGRILDDAVISSNLSEVIKAYGISQEEFAGKLEIKPQALTNYLNNTGGKKAKNLLHKLICLDVNGNWYLTGEGPMFMSDVNPASKADKDSEAVLRAEAAKMQLLIDRGMVKLPSTANVTAYMALPEGWEPIKVADSGPTVAEVPHYTHRIAAGLPGDSTGPAEKLSLPAMLVKHPKDTYAVTVSGDSMLRAGIEEGDILVVDRAIEPEDKSIVVASINGEQTVKRLKITEEGVSLMPENHKYPEMKITPEMDFRTLGVVVWVIRKAG